jgi:hypothetical protein
MRQNVNGQSWKEEGYNLNVSVDDENNSTAMFRIGVCLPVTLKNENPVAALH